MKSSNKKSWSSKWIGNRTQKWLSYFNRQETSTDDEFSTYYRSVACPSPNDYPMLWHSRSSSRIDAASVLAANSSSNCSSEVSPTDAVAQLLPSAQRARLSSSTSNLQRVITSDENPLPRGVQSSTTNGSCTNVEVFSKQQQNCEPTSKIVSLQKQQQKSASGSSSSSSSATGTSSLGRYASKLKSQLPPIHFGFENKKQANNNHSLNPSSPQNSARPIQRSSSGKATTTTTTAAEVTAVGNAAVNNFETTLQSSESLGGKISRSIYDLTSIERLRNWKAKLPSIRSKHHITSSSTSSSSPSSTNISEKASTNQSDGFSSAVPASSEIRPSNSQIPNFQQAVNGEEETLNGKNIKYDLPLNTATPPSTSTSTSTTIPAVNANQFSESRQTTTKVEFSSSADDHHSRVENCDSASRSCVENQSNHCFLSRNSPPLRRNTTADISVSVAGTDTPIRHSIGLLLAQTESIITMASNQTPENLMNSSKSSVESVGKFELQKIFSGSSYRHHHQKKTSEDDNKVYEEIDFPGWNKNGKDKSVDGEQLPPPARITPFSGIPQNKMGEVVRPTAFRPFTTSTGVSADLPTKKAVNVQQNNMFEQFALFSGFHETSGAFVPPLPPPRQALIAAVSPKQCPSDNETERYLINSYNYNKPDPPKYPSDTENMSAFYTSYHQRVAPHGPKVWQEGLGVNVRHSPNVKQKGVPKPQTNNSYIFANGDHDYDLVISTAANDQKPNVKPNQLFPALSNEYLQKRPLPSLPNQKHSLTTTTSSNNFSAGYQNQQAQQPNVAADNGQPALNYYSTTGSYSSRNSSGIHVTPSPSDSGMAELETVLKEKESELLQLRQTMEHNEQVIVRVYQEKEERWQEKLREWASRLEQAVSTEQKLLSQIQRLQDDRTDFQAKVQSLAADKHGLQRKCKELENELFTLKQQLQQNKDGRWGHCNRCENLLSPQTSSHDRNHRESSSDLNMTKNSPTPAEELRSEVDGLKDEVASLRKALHDQVYKFSQERKSWDIEKQRVLQYHKILQDSYNQLLRQNGVPNPILTDNNLNILQQQPQQVTPTIRVQKT